MQEFKARLSDREELNSKYMRVRLELVEPNHIEFLAGQYVLINVPGTTHRRSYSITSSPSIGHALDFLVDITPSGQATQFLATSALGTELTFHGPLGSFTLTQGEPELIFVATGSGLAPYLSMIDNLLIDQGDTRPLTLLWGERTTENLFGLEDMAQRERMHSNFKFHPTLSQPPVQGWPLCEGRVTDCLLVHNFSPQAGYYLCGNANMINDVKVLLAKKGVKPEQIHTESFHA